ncbi:MAG TPA: triose-phosphate isomerase [Gaiellales bacterium]|nr:triose-phosphate isomerase [Gaiellales bacterium]
MSGRTPFVAGNWKMHKTASETGAFVRELAGRLPDGVDVAVCVPFTSLAPAVQAAAGSRLQVYAQNMHQAAEGPFTGEISAAMLVDLGADGVLLGHSERRQYFAETDAALAEKLAAAGEAGLAAILAVGETEQEREAGETERVLARQIADSRATAHVGPLAIAYEPVWAIGTGRTATPEMAEDAHRFIRGLFDEPAASALRIQYGGSMKPDNAAELLAQPDIDGGLIGGASLVIDDFLAIVAAAL